MNDTELVRSLVDSLDTGLPERPDLGSVRSAGSRQRRRRHLGWAVGACAAASALVVPAVLLSGGGSPGSVAPDVAGPAPKAAVAAPLDAVAGPEFGVGMRAAVEQAVPGATFETEQLGDSWQWSQAHDAYFMRAGEPVAWETLFGWTQEFGLPGGAHLGVVASRSSDNPYLGGTGPASCDEAIFPSRQSCEVRSVDGRRVVVNDGIQYDDHGRWARQVDVFASARPRGMPAHVELTAYVDAATWAEASQALPSADDLAALGLLPALELPAPAYYPMPDDLEDHITSTP